MTSSKPRLGKLTRVKDLLVSEIWEELADDEEFMLYFPDIFHKRTPPREYFWKVFSVIRNDKYEELVSGKIDDLKLKRKIKPDTFAITPDAQRILGRFTDEGNLSLLGKITSQAPTGSKDRTEHDPPHVQEQHWR